MTSLTLNGEPIRYRLDPETKLLWALRDASNLTGTKYGCDDGGCGACTVIVDGEAVRSCQVRLAELEGAQVTTIEGLGGAHPVQKAWIAEQAMMCGACEPGFIMAAVALLDSNPGADDAAIGGITNICRCGAYSRIRRAIRAAGRLSREASVKPGS